MSTDRDRLLHLFTESRTFLSYCEVGSLEAGGWRSQWRSQELEGGELMRTVVLTPHCYVLIGPCGLRSESRDISRKSQQRRQKTNFK